MRRSGLLVLRLLENRSSVDEYPVRIGATPHHQHPDWGRISSAHGSGNRHGFL